MVGGTLGPRQIVPLLDEILATCLIIHSLRCYDHRLASPTTYFESQTGRGIGSPSICLFVGVLGHSALGRVNPDGIDFLSWDGYGQSQSKSNLFC